MAAATFIPIGTRVRVKGLVQQAHLNGREADILAPYPIKGRYRCKMQQGNEAVTIRCQRVNLDFVRNTQDTEPSTGLSLAEIKAAAVSSPALNAEATTTAAVSSAQEPESALFDTHIMTSVLIYLCVLGVT